MGLNIHTLPLGPMLANCHIVTDEATGLTAAIDPGGYSGELEKLLNGLDVRYILLTHGHFDHILGVPQLKERTEAKVAVHRADAGCLSSGEKSLALWEVPGMQKPVEADILLEDGDIIALGESRLRVLHTPGHTGGSVCYIEDSAHVIFSGDTLFSLTAGRTDLPGGDESALLASLKKLKALKGDYRIYTGHNRSTALNFERAHNPYLRDLP